MKGTTIAAISTPVGSGGIGMIRISGEEAIAVAERVFHPYGGKELDKQKGYTGCLGKIWDGDEPVDEAIAFVYRAPKSYTGENVVELSCHGGVYVMQRVLRLCLKHGARPAEPGEFTKRAFLNGKMDLVQAESVMQLIQAQGDAAMRAALSTRDGAVSREIEAVSDVLLEQAAHLAAWADYPEEDLIPVDETALQAALAQVEQRLQKLLATCDGGRVVKEGVRTAIVGKPNVGKSTLMNLLAGEEKSIVTDIPGTTRDVVEDSVRMGDLVLHLYDTAGIRDTEDVIEQIGVEKARNVLESTDLVLAVFDSSQELGTYDWEIMETLREKPVIAIVNKIDMPRQLDMDAIEQRFSDVVALSARSGDGMSRLEERIREKIHVDKLDASQPILSNERQRAAVAAALESVTLARGALQGGMTYDAINVELDFALEALMELVGKRVTDAVVDQVFHQFCVGK
ncbi:tRNA uridine-5-carboxymethylaminomethyl(34) synthesis GTPase MnmE [Ruminococcaceae bacterium OttesenSCG-928-L11]|nr:tRNA uridine-5-carboxymethylaminomethyl(34) synthesis GTPase MnmE [Ruminococcaceae bacterium OttesenSCG-928-L11]